MEFLQLFAPNESPIVAAVASDGSSRAFRYSYNSTSMVRLYVLDDGTELGEAPLRLRARDGTEWDSFEVEWYTLMKRARQKSKSGDGVE